MTNITKKKTVPSLNEILKNLDYYLAVVCMMFVTIYCFINVICRFFFGKTSAALDELNIIIFVWFLYAAITYCVRLDKHIRIEILDLYISEKANAFLKVISDTIWLIFSAYIAYAGFQLINFNLKYVAKTSILEIPMYIVYSIVFISFIAMTIFLLSNLCIKIKRLQILLKNERKK